MSDNEPEVLPATDGSMSGSEALVASGATLMRVEHDAMMAVSVQRPRSKKKVLTASIEELDLVPSLAPGCYYSIPYKKSGGGTEIVTGPTIHAARNLARNWGNCAAKSVVTGEDAERITLAGIFTDLETNVRFERPLTVSKWFKRRGGGREKLNDQRLVQAIQAGASKAERNAILAGLPDWLVKSYDQKARQLAADSTRQDLSKMVDAFLVLGVTRETLEEWAGCSLQKATDEQLADLRGFYVAIRDKETTADDVFGDAEAPEKPTDASISDVLKGGADVTDGSEKPTDPGAPSAEEQADIIARESEEGQQ